MEHSILTLIAVFRYRRIMREVSIQLETQYLPSVYAWTPCGFRSKPETYLLSTYPFWHFSKEGKKVWIPFAPTYRENVKKKKAHDISKVETKFIILPFIKKKKNSSLALTKDEFYEFTSIYHRDEVSIKFLFPDNKFLFAYERLSPIFFYTFRSTWFIRFA